MYILSSNIGTQYLLYIIFVFSSLTLYKRQSFYLDAQYLLEELSCIGLLNW